MKYESIGSGSTNGTQPQANMSYSPLPMIVVSWLSSATFLVVAMPISLQPTVTNSEISGPVSPSERT